MVAHELAAQRSRRLERQPNGGLGSPGDVALRVGPPMSGFTLPGQTELTHLGWCSKAGATTMAVTTIMKIEMRITEFRRKAPIPTAARR